MVSLNNWYHKVSPCWIHNMGKFWSILFFLAISFLNSFPFQSLEKDHFLFCHWRAATNCNTIPEYHLQISSAASPVGIANVRWTPSSAATPRTWRSCARAATPSPTRWPASGAPCPGATHSSFSAPPPSCQERAILERTVPGMKLAKYLCGSLWFLYLGATEKYSTTSECQRKGKRITRGNKLKHEATIQNCPGAPPVRTAKRILEQRTSWTVSNTCHFHFLANGGLLESSLGGSVRIADRGCWWAL